MTRPVTRTLTALAGVFVLGALPLVAAPPQAPPIITVNPTPTDCFSGAGCLDPGFGNLGQVVQDVGGNPQYAYGVAAQPDGKVVVVGSRRLIATPNDFSWAIARFNANGTLDTTFGTNGVTGLDLYSGVNNIEQARAVVIQSDGKIVVGGFGDAATNTHYVALLRLNASGTPDSTFGTGGKAVFTYIGYLTALAQQADGKIVAVSSTFGSSGSYSTFFRVQTNGTLDKKFGSGGLRQVSGIYTNVLALQASGNIVAAGHNFNGVTNDPKDFTLTRLSASGDVDNRFGNRGIVNVDFFGYEDEATALAVAPDDSIIAAGRTNTAPFVPYTPGGPFMATTFNMGFARLSSSGALVATFGTGGRVVLDMNGGRDGVSDVAVQSNGAIVFGGNARLADDSNGFFIAGRLTAGGALDSSFGTGGVTESSLSYDDQTNGMTLDSAGHVCIIGSSYSRYPEGNPNTWLVARYFR